MRNGWVTRAEAWQLTQTVLATLGKSDELSALEHAARLVGKDAFEAATRFGFVSFKAFCTARSLGASDQTLREMLKPR